MEPIAFEISPGIDFRLARIARVYNHVLKEIEDLLTAKLPIEKFKGLVSGESVTRVMFDECRYVNSVYAAVVGRIRTAGQT